MSSFGKVLAVEAKLVSREIPMLIFSIALPTVILVVLGVIPALRRPDEMFGGKSFVALFAPSLLVVTLAMVGLNALPTTLATYRERGVLRRLSTTPATPASLLAAQLIVSLGMTVAGAALLVTVGRLAFDIPLPGHVPGFVLTFVLGAAALFGIGLLVAAVAPNAKAAGGLAAGLFMLTMFFGGVYVPRTMLPDFLVRIGDYTPPGVQALLDSWTGASPQPAQLGIMALVAVAASVLAAKLFRWE